MTTLRATVKGRLGQLVGSLAVMVGGIANAFEFDARLTFGFRASETEATPLVEDPDAAGFSESERYLHSILTFQQDIGLLRFSGQGRFVLDDTEGAPNGRSAKAGTDATLDELNVAYSLSETMILYMGRRNLSAGQSLGINPADVFLDESQLDRHLPPERQRSEIKGIDMAGVEYFFAEGGSMHANWAPSTGRLNEDAPDRAHLSYRTTLGENLMDLTLYAFDDTAPGAGISVTYPFNNGLIHYGDVVFRKGRLLPELHTNGSVDVYDTNRWTIEGTLGLSYIFRSGLAANFEFTHLTGGYNHVEWEQFGNLIAANSPPASPTQGATLAKLGQIAAADYLRRNYAFLRFHNPSILGSRFEAELVTLLGVDDGSGNVNLRLYRDLNDAFSLSLLIEATFGEEGDDFRRGVDRRSAGLYLEVTL